MLKRLEDKKQSLRAFFDDCEDIDVSIEDLSTTEWKLLSELVKLLQPLEESTNRMCTSKFASISLLLPIVNGMIFGVKNEINRTITSAAILDPRV